MNLAASLACVFLVMLPVFGQELGQPDAAKPGDKMIQQYLSAEAKGLETDFLGDVMTARDWLRERPRWRQEYFEMLGLDPMPPLTDLHAAVTRTLDRGDYQVEMVHYQSRPGLYVTGNLYRPARIDPGDQLPAIFYVCGHSDRGRDGNKTAYQSHGIWFARHGYICLIVDTLQLGEIPGIHHGTYREGRWWWVSRGYTPAGVECWNGIRGIDYLTSRPEVDPERIGVTGISGGGAATYWIAAADERVKVAVPVSGMADLTSYIPNRVINGHCDCMFLYNTYQWPWTRIAGLIAPRPVLFVNSDHDEIFPMDANERVINRLERLYSLFGAGDRVDALVSIGGHAYRQDIRQSGFRFLNTYLKNDPHPVLDSEVDLVGTGPNPVHPIPPAELRVFPTDSDVPADALNRTIDQQFVLAAVPKLPQSAQFGNWQRELRSKLRRMTFHHFPEKIPPAVEMTGNEPSQPSQPNVTWLKTERDLRIRLLGPAALPATAKMLVLHIARKGGNTPDFSHKPSNQELQLVCEPRGTGATEWTTKNPPNYVERSHFLLGRTADSGRIWDIIATVGYLRAKYPDTELILSGEREAAVLAIYAAIISPSIEHLRLNEPLPSLMVEGAPALLNALRVCDLPAALGLIAPRPVEIHAANKEEWKRSSALYRINGTAQKLSWY